MFRLKAKHLVLAIVIFVSGLFLSIFLRDFFDNIHPVIDQQVYRSAQLQKDKLIQVIQQYKIRSIINLRNKHPEERWYRDEVMAAQQNDVQHFDLSFSAFRQPTSEQLLTLLSTLKMAKKPVLVHCRYGVDRSGLAAAMALILTNKATVAEIEDQVSWRHRVLRSNSVGKLVMQPYLQWLQQQQLTPNEITFRQWLQTR